MRRWFVMTAVMLLVVAACGGDSGDEAGGGDDQPESTPVATTRADSGATNPPPGEDGETNDGGGDAGGDTDGSGPSTATVTLGDVSYTFSTEGAVVAQCLTDLFGIFSVQLPRVDDAGVPADGNVAIVALHADTDPNEVGEVNAIEVAVGDEDWVADEADVLFETSDVLQPGMSQVDSVEIDGRTVRGTATFVRQNSVFTGEVETVTGTFEATCGEERTS